MNPRAHPLSWRPAPTVVWLPEPASESAGAPEAPQRIYLLDMDAEVPVILEQTSALIWAALMERLAQPSSASGEGVTAQQIAEDLAADAQLEPQEIQPDIERFLADLGSSGLLQRAAGGAAA